MDATIFALFSSMNIKFSLKFFCFIGLGLVVLPRIHVRAHLGSFPLLEYNSKVENKIVRVRPDFVEYRSATFAWLFR